MLEALDLLPPVLFQFLRVMHMLASAFLVPLISSQINTTPFGRCLTIFLPQSTVRSQSVGLYSR